MVFTFSFTSFPSVSLSSSALTERCSSAACAEMYEIIKRQRFEFPARRQTNDISKNDMEVVKNCVPSFCKAKQTLNSFFVLSFCSILPTSLHKEAQLPQHRPHQHQELRQDHLNKGLFYPVSQSSSVTTLIIGCTGFSQNLMQHIILPSLCSK